MSKQYHHIKATITDTANANNVVNIDRHVIIGSNQTAKDIVLKSIKSNPNLYNLFEDFYLTITSCQPVDDSEILVASISRASLCGFLNHIQSKSLKPSHWHKQIFMQFFGNLFEYNAGEPSVPAPTVVKNWCEQQKFDDDSSGYGVVNGYAITHNEVNQQALLKRGWTKGMITKFLGEPDRQGNAFEKGSLFYAIDRIKKVEESKEFEPYLKRLL